MLFENQCFVKRYFGLLLLLRESLPKLHTTPFDSGDIRDRFCAKVSMKFIALLAVLCHNQLLRRPYNSCKPILTSPLGGSGVTNRSQTNQIGSCTNGSCFPVHNNMHVRYRHFEWLPPSAENVIDFYIRR